MKPNHHFDCIVVGLGGVGSAALYHGARHGWKILGIEQFSVGHQRGSSHGHTRIIRQAYFEHPDYVPLAQEAYQRWDELQQRCGQQLRRPTGLLQVGLPGGDVINGLLQCAQAYDLAIDHLTTAAARSRFPMFHIVDGSQAVFETVAGYLLVERCVHAHLELAVKHGAQIRSEERVERWEVADGSVKVKTGRSQYNADRLILAAGPWADEVLRDLQMSLTVVRKPQHWFAVDDDRFTEQAGCPAFLFETDRGVFYGFPSIARRGVKVAQHTGGLSVDPLTVDRQLDRAELAEVQRFVREYLPALEARSIDHSVCLYTRSADEHFFVDCHPEFDNVVFAAGLSGHGFKFTPVLGRYLVEMLTGVRRSELKFLALDNSRR